MVWLCLYQTKRLSTWQRTVNLSRDRPAASLGDRLLAGHGVAGHGDCHVCTLLELVGLSSKATLFGWELVAMLTWVYSVRISAVKLHGIQDWIAR